MRNHVSSNYKISVFGQIESQFNSKFLSNMILLRFVIVSALLFASANAVLDQIFNSLMNAVKDNVNFWSTLARTVIEAPLKILPSSSQSPALLDGQSEDGNIEDEIKNLKSFLAFTAKGIQDAEKLIGT